MNVWPILSPFIPLPDFGVRTYFATSFSPQSTGYYPDQPANLDPTLQVRLIPNWWDGLTVEIYPAPGSEYERFGIYYGISESGPFELVTPGYVQSYAYTFTSNKVNLKYNQPFLFVEAQGPDGVFVSPLVTWFNSRAQKIVQNAALDLTRREWVFLRKLVGVPILLFKRRVSGKRCPSCWNVQYQKMMKDHCDFCYNTSFAGGYYPPVYSLAQFEPLSKSEVEVETGKQEPGSLSGWTINFPIINPGDLVYRIPDGRMFRAMRIDNTEMQSTVIRQQLSLLELDREMVEYKLARQVPPVSYLSAFMSRQNPWLNPVSNPGINPSTYNGNGMDINAVVTL